MAYTPKFGRLPKDDEPINSASDEADRSIHEVERENEKYYLEQKKIAEGVTRIQSGVRAGAAATLKGRAGKNANNVNILTGEKIQNELYKAVEGNDVYENERGDNKNWENSLSAEYLNSGTLGKLKLKGKRYVRGVLAVAGRDNLVAQRVKERFGEADKSLGERKAHVVDRLKMELVKMDSKDVLRIARGLGIDVKNYVNSNGKIEGFWNGIVETIVNIDTDVLRKIGKLPLRKGTLGDKPAFKDFLLIMDLEQRESAKTGVEGVYDAEKLHDFYNGMKYDQGVVAIDPQHDFQKYKKYALDELEKDMADIVAVDLPTIPDSFEALKPSLLSLDESHLEKILSLIGYSLQNNIQINKDEAVEKILVTLLQYKSINLTNFIQSIIVIKKTVNTPEVDTFVDDILKLVMKNGDYRKFGQSTLRELGENLGLNSLRAFQRLLFIKEFEQKEPGEVINPVVEVAEMFDAIIKSHSMWPLKDHPEGLALMAQMKFRLRTISPADEFKTEKLRLAAQAYVAKNSPNLEGQNLEEAIQKTYLEFVKAATFAEELRNIGKEAPKKIIESEEKKREEINELQKEILKTRKNTEASYINVLSIYKRKVETAESAAIAESILRNATDNKTKNPEANYIKEAEAKKEAERDYREALKDLHSLESEFMDKVVKLKISLEEINPGSSKEIPMIQEMLSFKKTSREDIENGLKMPNDLDKELEKARKAKDTEKVDALEEEKRRIGGKFYTLIKDKEEQAWIDFQAKIDDIQGEISKLTPFQLLQKMLRREYLERRDPTHDPAHFHERAARYSLLTAAMRVQDVKNIDLNRNVNKKVAEHLRQWKIGKMYGKVASNLNLAGRKVGIELVEGDKESVSSLLEQVIQSDEAKFAVFRGIDKYTTPRDLRKMLYESGKEVSLETMEEFIAILENILDGVKRGDDKYLKTLMHGDWDLENLILTLQKFKIERWTQQYMDKVVATEGNREHALLDLLRERREEDEKINREIHKNVKSPDAMWKRQLSKNAIKESLNEKILNSNEQIRATGMDQAKKEIADLENSIKDLDDGDSKKIAGLRKIEELKSNIGRTERELTQSRDLYEKVEAFKETLEKGSLSRKEAKKLAAEMGLAQIYDKMGMNFRLQRYWKKTVAGLKKAGGWTWDKTKKVGSWTNAKFFNRETARKAFSLARKGATPITYPLGLAWKAGSFPVRLVGRAMAGAVSLPGGIWRQVSSSSMKSYLRDFPIDINFKKQKLENDKADLKDSLAKAPYEWDKKRIMRKMNRIDEKIEKLNEEMARASAKAAKLGLTI